MEDPQRRRPHQDVLPVPGPGVTETPAADDAQLSSSPSKLKGSYQWWLQVIVYSTFLLAGQTAGTLLGRIYFNNGGNSQWLATLLLLVGFPVLVPFRWLQFRNPNQDQDVSRRPEIERTRLDQHRKFPPILAGIYVALGVFAAADCLLYSIGLQYLPVTTYTLICASQLGFNALFSYILNGQKFTPYIVNSLVLLTLSSVLLVFQPETSSSSSSPMSNKKHVIGFICTVGASAGYAFTLSITQLAFQRIIKRETAATVVDMAVYQSLVASAIVVVGLFASGEWRKLHGEMTGYRRGAAAYLMNVIWTAVAWQMFSVGCIGLIFRVSALFSNVISVVGTPLGPAMAVVVLGEKMTGVKGVAVVAATWGVASYMYQHYLDDLEKKTVDDDKKEVGELVTVAMAAAPAPPPAPCE